MARRHGQSSAVVWMGGLEGDPKLLQELFGIGDEPSQGLALATVLSCCSGVMRHLHHGDPKRARAGDVLRG